MLVHRPRLKTQGAAVTTVAMLALGACDDPAARTDLRPEGKPDVLAVLVLNDAVSGLIESAAYCKPGDEKRPGLVGLPDFTTQQICPEVLSEEAPPLTNAAPELWYVRVMFDELLDPSVEELIPVLDDNNQPTDVYTGSLRNTQPVVLQCRDTANNFVNIDYDGYYAPSGNAVTWPLGPSLVIKPEDPAIIPVDTECQVTLKETITDKSGNTPDKLGPFTFKIAPVQIIGISPEPDEKVDPDFGGVDLTFNVAVRPAGLEGQFTFTPAVTNTGVYQSSSNPSGAFIYGDILDSESYAFEIAPGTMVEDKCGKASALVAGENLKTNFKTNPLELLSITPFQGPGALPSRKIRMNFNQSMDLATLEAGTDYEWVGEVPETFAFTYDSSGDTSIIVLSGQYKLGTNYKFKLKANAKIKDCPSRATVGDCSVSTRELTIPEEILIDITTANEITNTAVSIGAGSTSPRSASVTTITGSGGQTVHKRSEAENVFVRFSFNQDMEGKTLRADEISITKEDDTPTGIDLPISVSCPDTAQACGSGTGAVTTFNVGALPAGTYKFKLKAGATINDRFITPGTYTQAADREFTFHVEVNPPAPLSCLGAP